MISYTTEDIMALSKDSPHLNLYCTNILKVFIIFVLIYLYFSSIRFKPDIDVWYNKSHQTCSAGELFSTGPFGVNIVLGDEYGGCVTCERYSIKGRSISRYDPHLIAREIERS